MVVPNFFPSKGNVLKYNGFKELAYLHPNYFVPNKKILEDYDLEQDKYVFIREVSKGSLNYKNVPPIGLSKILDLFLVLD